MTLLIRPVTSAKMTVPQGRWTGSPGWRIPRRRRDLSIKVGGNDHDFEGAKKWNVKALPFNSSRLSPE